MTYFLLDSGNQRKLERFGAFTLSRPCATALWKPKKLSLWEEADALFSRGKGSLGSDWCFRKKLPPQWLTQLEGLNFKVALTEFGHLGLFPEHAALWQKIATIIEGEEKPFRFLNLFAYSGGATLAAARAGAEVCHLDASAAMVQWARENCHHNHLRQAPIRWIVDDVLKFLKRAVRRGERYEGILLDPPSFGRGSRKEVFKFEEDIGLLLDLCFALLSERANFVILSCHTPGITPQILSHLLRERRANGKIEAAELIIEGETPLPSGAFAHWSSK
jgi:23S rRNA (cytosine1962-C5)-methyltransferase